MNQNTPNQPLDWVTEADAKRGNRMCISVSDIHLTDGTVGFQNLSDHSWQRFYDAVLQRCKSYQIDELLFVLNGDIVDMIRSSRWAEHGVYPWQRDSEQFAVIVQKILDQILLNHQGFFTLLKQLPARLQQDGGVARVKLVVTLGNHDKELFCVPDALAKFYRQGLGIELADITAEERRAIGRMYGDERMFSAVETPPYFPFYYADCGFRLFATHGQWRDGANCREVSAQHHGVGWSVSDGWRPERWKQLNFAPFLQPCFGDTVAAGVLSTFIYQVKTAMAEQGYQNARLNSILDELDLYRPTYLALERILRETSAMREKEQGSEVVEMIEDKLYQVLQQWLHWEFTYQSCRQGWLRTTLKGIRVGLRWFERRGGRLQIAVLRTGLKIMAWYQGLFSHALTLNDMARFPGFLPQYRHYGFQIHSEGHTHIPLQEQPNLHGAHPSTYINLGTWRDQIVRRKKSGFRRQGVLRCLYILDLQNYSEDLPDDQRSFDYFVEDAVIWSDAKDAMDKRNNAQPKI